MSGTSTPFVSKPIFTYDGECEFCRKWAEAWQQDVRQQVHFRPYQKIQDQYPRIPADTFRQGVVFIRPDRSHLTNVEAILHLLALIPRKTWLLWLYKHIPGVRPFLEWGYRFVARHRSFFAVYTRFLLPKTKATPKK